MRLLRVAEAVRARGHQGDVDRLRPLVRHQALVEDGDVNPAAGPVAHAGGVLGEVDPHRLLGAQERAVTARAGSLAADAAHRRATGHRLAEAEAVARVDDAPRAGTKRVAWWLFTKATGRVTSSSRWMPRRCSA